MQEIKGQDMPHPLHRAVADVVCKLLDKRFDIVKDPACGGKQQVPLFIGARKGLNSRMCCVDLLVLLSETVRAIIEIEESGFLPTKICGKFLQTAIATHFIHDSHLGTAIPYAEKVLFLQILDRSSWPKSGSQKASQAKLIEKEIQKILPLRGITEYRLFVVSGANDQQGLASVGNWILQLIDGDMSGKET
jgi:hypothetical protein